MRTLIVLLVLLLALPAQAQETDRRQRVRERLMERFDGNGDGRLDSAEREQVRAFLGKWKRESSQPVTAIPGLYGTETGPNAVKKLELKMEDSDRGKTLEVRVTYPAEAGRYPVILWSHGAFGSKNNYDPLVEHWVSHGYVCIQPSHSDSLSLGGDRRPDVNDPSNFRDWKSRPEDIAFLMDRLLELEGRLPVGLLTERIGVGGHSYGAHTSQLLAGARTVVGDHSDPRPRCFVLISPQGPGQLLRENAWEQVTRPVLAITGSQDVSGRTQETPEWRLAPFRLSPPGQKYLLWIEGAYHGFGGIAGAVRFPSSGPSNPDHVAYVRSATLALWDAHLKDDPGAGGYLEANNLGQVSGGEARWTVR